MTGRRLVAIAAMMALWTGCSSEEPATATTSSAPATSPIEAGDAVDAFAAALDEIADRDTAEGAAHELALVIGPIDGVDVEPLPGPHHGTLALRRFQHFAAEADESLRQAVNQRLDEIDASTIADFEVEVEPGSASTGGQVVAGEPQLVDVAFQVGTDRVNEDSADLSDTDRARFERMRVAAEEAAGYVREIADQRLRVGFALVTEFEDATTIAASRTETNVGIGPGCRVYFSRAAADDALELVPTMVHELVHCLQFEIEPTSGALPLWVQEGAADHLAAHFAGATPRTQAWATRFLTANPFDLAGSDYAAAGFFDHLADEGADVVALAPRLFRSGATGDDAYIRMATEGLGADVHANFAAGPAQRSDLGGEWTISGPAIPLGSERRARTLALGSVAAVDALASGTWELTRPDGDVLVVKVSGDVRYSWGTGSDFVVSGGSETERWCLGEECSCPSGTPVPGDPKPLPAGAEFLTIALSATRGPSSAVADVEGFDELCEPETTPDDDGDDPGSLVGTWLATPDAIQRFLERAWASAGDSDPFVGGEAPSFTYLGGDMVMTLSPGGSGEFTVVDLVVQISVSGVEARVPMSGAGTFLYRLDGSTIRFSSMTTQLVADLFGEPLVIDTGDVGTGNSSATIGLLSADQLILEPLEEEWVVPNEWVRR